MKLKRRAQFYFNIFVVPPIIMLFILPALHFFPPGCTQKTTLGRWIQPHLRHVLQIVPLLLSSLMNYSSWKYAEHFFNQPVLRSFPKLSFRYCKWQQIVCDCERATSKRSWLATLLCCTLVDNLVINKHNYYSPSGVNEVNIGLLKQIFAFQQILPLKAQKP